MTSEHSLPIKNAKRQFFRFVFGVFIVFLIALFAAPSNLVMAETVKDRGDYEGSFKETTVFSIDEKAQVLLSEQWEGQFTQKVNNLSLDFLHEADESFTLESVAVSADPQANIFVELEPLSLTNLQSGYELENHDTGTRLDITYEFEPEYQYGLVVVLRLSGSLKDFDSRIGGYYTLPIWSHKVCLEPYNFYMPQTGSALTETVRIESSFESPLEPVEDLFFQAERLKSDLQNTIAFSFDHSLGHNPDIPRATVSEKEHFQKMEEVRKANLQYQAAAINLRTMMWITMIAAYICALLLYLFYNREWLWRRKDEHVQMADIYPVTVPLLLYKKQSMVQVLLSALLDLVYRNELKLEQGVFISQKRTDDDWSHLTAPDICLMEWMFDEIAKEGSLSADMITEYISDPKRMAEFKKGHRDYCSLVYQEQVKYGFFLPIKNRYGKILYFSFAIGVAAIMVILAVWTKTLYPLLLLPIIIGATIIAGTSRFSTRLGRHYVTRIRRVLRALKDSEQFDAMLASQPNSEKMLLRLFSLAAGFGKISDYLNRVGESDKFKQPVMDKYSGVIDPNEQSRILGKKVGVQISDDILRESRWQAFCKGVKQLEFDYTSILLRADLKAQEGKKENHD